jgi:flagellar basal-body rod protein FlgG
MGIYSAAAGMAAQQARLDAIANDIANASTTGYKQVRTGFRDLVYAQQQGAPVGSGAAAVDMGRSMRQGTLADVQDPLSLAIEGPGFFQVRMPDGSTGLTRDGSFRLDAQRHLVTASGAPLVPPVTLTAGTAPEDVSIAQDGTVTHAGRTIGRITIVDVPAPEGLRAVGDNVFAATTASGKAAAARSSQVHQGALEQSNVDVADAMTQMLDAQRSFDLTSRVVKMQDQLLEIANGLRR